MHHHVLTLIIVPVLIAAVADRPPMGWNSWYAFGRAAGWPITNETNIKRTADLMVSLGLRDAGYEFVIVDDSWENTHREPDGRLIANPAKFPSGMRSVSAYTRARGMQLGLYTTPGRYTCSGEQGGGEPGSFGHIQQDVDLWVSDWGIGYLKDCVCNTTKQLRTHAYRDMKAALDRADRSVTYECDPFMDKPWETLNGVCNLWVVSDDIADSFSAWTTQVDLSYADNVTKSAHPGSWALFDYLQIGNGGQTLPEYRSQFAMFAMLAAPLIVGSDLSTISKESLGVYLSTEVVAVDQDPLGIPGIRLWQHKMGAEVWARELSRNPRQQSGPVCAVFLFNRGQTTQNVTAAWAELAALGTPWVGMESGAVRDLFARKEVGEWTNSVTIELAPHASVLFRVTRLK